MSKWIAWTHLRHDMAHVLALPRHASSPTRIPSDRTRQTHGLQLRTGTVFAFNEMKAPLISNNTPWRSIMQIKKAHRIMYSLDPKAMCNGKADVPISCPNWHSSHTQHFQYETVSPRCAKSSCNAHGNVHNRPQCLCACSSLKLCGSNVSLCVSMRTLMHT